MPTLHVFNPSHDEALAAPSPYYTPTKAARTLARDLAVLPAWWAQEGDYVLLPNDAPFSKHLLPMHVRYIREDDIRRLSSGAIDRIEPWGWDAALVHRLQRMGVEPALLHNEETLHGIKQLSSRRTACTILPSLHEHIPNSMGESAWCTRVEEVERVVGQYGNAILKAPWSCSGRGVFRAEHPMTPHTLARVEAILRTQKGIEAEPLYARKADLALEFYMDDGLRYEGLSLFHSTPNGSYGGNLLQPEEELWSLLPEEIRIALDKARTVLPKVLTPLLQNVYRGPLGVDMMVVATAQGLHLHPCVEVNLRNTMGRVACLLSKGFPETKLRRYLLLPLAELKNQAVLQRLTPDGIDIQAIIAS